MKILIFVLLTIFVNEGKMEDIENSTIGFQEVSVSSNHHLSNKTKLDLFGQPSKSESPSPVDLNEKSSTYHQTKPGSPTIPEHTEKQMKPGRPDSKYRRLAELVSGNL